MRHLCQYKQGCFGCCGKHFLGKRSVLVRIKKNTSELASYQPTSINEWRSFRDRSSSDVQLAGTCPNLVFLPNGNIGCPLHPAQHKGNDLREKYCHTTYFCSTFTAYKAASHDMQHAFEAFLDRLDLDVYAYSKGMDSGKLWKQFIKQRG